MFNDRHDVIPQSPQLLEEAYETAYGVYHDMSEMRDRLGDTGLEHVIPFNQVYQELSGDVAQAILRGEFELPHVVARTMPIFYDYYARAVRSHESGDTYEISAPWQQSFYDERAKRVLPGTQFLLGMNIHINTDLAQATSDSGAGDEYYPDYRNVVGKLIDITAHRLSSDFIPGPSVSRRALTGATVYTIARWREKAWQARRKLQAEEDEVAVGGIVRKLERSTLRKGEQILTVGNFALNNLERIAA